jgi:hypothetical protein
MSIWSLHILAIQFWYKGSFFAIFLVYGLREKKRDCWILMTERENEY